jgi:hypothetical protein
MAMNSLTLPAARTPAHRRQGRPIETREQSQHRHKDMSSGHRINGLGDHEGTGHRDREL